MMVLILRGGRQGRNKIKGSNQTTKSNQSSMKEADKVLSPSTAPTQSNMKVETRTTREEGTTIYKWCLQSRKWEQDKSMEGMQGPHNQSPLSSLVGKATWFLSTNRCSSNQTAEVAKAPR